MSNQTSQQPFVRAVPQSAAINTPKIQVAIVIDTAYIVANAGKPISSGIYMMDNQLNAGSNNEGQLELSTICPPGSLIGFTAYPLDTNSGDQIAITGFNVSQGNVFGNQGYPLRISPNYWIGQATNAGNQIYQIQVKVTSGGLRPTDYYINWDPYITVR